MAGNLADKIRAQRGSSAAWLRGCMNTGFRRQAGAAENNQDDSGPGWATQDGADADAGRPRVSEPTRTDVWVTDSTIGNEHLILELFLYGDNMTFKQK